MGEKLIHAVSKYPIIYNPSLKSYSDFNKKNEAWKQIAETVGLPVDKCRQKWMSFCDVYVRERREEKNKKKKKKSGAAATQKRPWRHYQKMSFLLPFLSSLPKAGNMKEKRREKRRNEEKRAEERQGQEKRRMDSLVEDKESRKRKISNFAQPEKRCKTVEASSVSPFEKKSVEAVETSTPAVLPDPDLQFLQSLLPALKRFDIQSRALVKLKMHELIFEAEFKRPHS
nr:transcription factor Adf-1-like [Misgurnus anguillicaudatus]